jgi:hypothetical protein
MSNPIKVVVLFVLLAIVGIVVLSKRDPDEVWDDIIEEEDIHH